MVLKVCASVKYLYNLAIHTEISEKELIQYLGFVQTNLRPRRKLRGLGEIQ